MGQVATPQAIVSEHGQPVPYIDISQLVWQWPRIDLVKCDIEGSEGDFLRFHPEVLKKAHTAVFEFHEVASPVISECRELLMSYGLTENKCLRTFSDNTIELFWRPPSVRPLS